MPRYLIEQYETHGQVYEVDAENEIEAVVNVLLGSVDASDNGQEYIEVNDDLGLPADGYPELAAELRRRGLSSVKEIIPSIRSIEVIHEPKK